MPEKKLITFLIKCPMNGDTHDGVVKELVAKDSAVIVTAEECHKSHECQTCRCCLSAIWTAAKDGEQFNGIDPLDPVLLPGWKGAGGSQPKR